MLETAAEEKENAPGRVDDENERLRVSVCSS
jgi:hypothetical protein